MRQHLPVVDVHWRIHTGRLAAQKVTFGSCPEPDEAEAEAEV